MSNLILKVTSDDTNQDTRNLLATGGARNKLTEFLSKSGEQTNAKLSAQLLNNDCTRASATVTMDSDNQTDGDTIQIGTMILTARDGVSDNPLAPDMGTLDDFAILGMDGVTGSAAPGTVVTGDVGSSPTATITNFPPSTVVGGTLHLTNDAAVIQAHTDLIAAYADLEGRTPLTTEGVTDLGGATKYPGVYAYSSSVAITGTLTLDAQGDADAVWIFQVGSTLTTATSSIVDVIGGGNKGNVYWQIGSSATIGASSTFVGNVLANISITLSGAPSTVEGRLLAGASNSSGAVTIAVGGGTVTKLTGTAGGGSETVGEGEFLIGSTDTESATNLAEAINEFSNNPSAPSMGSLGDFAILGRSGVTGSAAPGTVVTGSVGSSPTATITNFPPSTVVGGTLHLTNDATVIQAQLDLIAAYNDLEARTPLSTEGVTDLGGATKTPGVYAYSTSLAITGTLTLDAQGDPNATWIFQIGSTLTTASSSVVTIINGGNAGNVYWQVGSSATIGASSTFLGNVLASVSITLSGAPSTVTGRLLAGAGGSTGAVTIATGGGTVSKATGTAGGNSEHLITATSSGAVVTVYAGFCGVLGNMIPIIITQTDPGMTASGNLTGGTDDSSVAVDYRNF